MSSSKVFSKAYSKLNPKQRLAVDTIDGPVMVVAGPGTGKTQTIALRIANILKETDTDPSAILALTFTESGAKAMRERLESFIGHTAYYVEISTFHSFCVNVIRENPDYFTLDPSAEPISELEKLKIFHKILEENKFKTIKPPNSPFHYARALMQSIQDLKREGVSIKEFENLLKIEKSLLDSEESEELTKTKKNKRARDLSKNLELAKVYKEYQHNLRQKGTYDFEDMINFVLEKFSENEELLRIYQERFQYFLVDEYQDTNSAQNKVVNLLASYWKERANIFVVGDPDQSIMRFQGASLENFLSFAKNYPTTTVITLTQNYRSTQTILDAATTLIDNNSLKIENVVDIEDPTLHSNSNEDSKIILSALPTQLSESLSIGDKIKQLIERGVNPSDIAIIYRNNKDAHDISDVLIKLGIDYTIQGGGNILEDKTVQKLLKILTVISELRSKKDDLNLFTILHYDIFSVDPLDVLKISRAASDNKATLFDIIENKEILNDLALSSPKKISSVLDLLSTWQSIDANSTFTQFFETVLNESGFLNWILNSKDSHNKLARINTLFQEVKKMNQQDHALDLAGFLQNLEVMQENNISISESHITPHQDSVVLTTAHSSKGLEWDHVFIYQAYDKKWGNKITRNLINLPSEILPMSDLTNKEKNEDERRLFYVAMTRAKHTLTITHASTYSSYGRTKETVPSMFVSEIGDSYTKKLDPKNNKNKEKQLKNLLSTPTQEPPKDEEPYLKELVSKFSLSVTSLNTYLECPYKFKLNNLLKVPRAKAPYLAFGTSVHKALESFYRKFKEDSKYPREDFLISEFKKALSKEILTESEHINRESQGKMILSSYYKFHQDDFREPLFIEKFSRVYLDDISLTGKIDMITWDDPADKLVKVTDFKTGKPKTKGQIKGSTKDSKGNLYRQLVFYKLLIDLDRRLKVKLNSAELDFVQAPADKNKSGKNTFVITQEETTQLKKTIKEVMQEIRSLNFQRTTDYTNCIRCEFKDHCWPDGVPNN